MTDDPRELLRRDVRCGRRAPASPELRIPGHLPRPPQRAYDRIGAGKASAAMAKARRGSLADVITGLVVTRYGHAVPCQADRDRRSLTSGARRARPDGRPAHPENGARAWTRRSRTRPDFWWWIGFAQLAGRGLTFDDKQAVNAALLRSGATIGEMNCVRKHLSAIKGGRLAAAAYPAHVVTLVISDVPGDDPADDRLRARPSPTVPRLQTRLRCSKYRITNHVL